MILITGYKGMLGKAFKNALPDAQIADIDIVDIANYEEFNVFIKDIDPDIIIHAAAYTDVEKAEENFYDAYKGNVLTTMNIAEYARKNNVYVVFFSTDYLFHGYYSNPIREEEMPLVKGVYAYTKLLAENVVKTLNKHLIIRTSWLYGEGKNNFVEKVLKIMENTDILYGTINEVSTPTYTKDLVQATINLIKRNIYGVVHFSNKGYISRYGWINEIAKLIDYKGEIKKVHQGYFNMKAPRPIFSALCTDKYENLTGEKILSWQDALAEYMQNRRK